MHHIKTHKHKIQAFFRAKLNLQSFFIFFPGITLYIKVYSNINYEQV